MSVLVLACSGTVLASVLLRSCVRSNDSPKHGVCVVRLREKILVCLVH